MNFFIGIEAEGDKKGVQTLFIGDFKNANIKKLILFLVARKINRVYFGANNFRQLPFWFIEFVESCPKNISIVAEIKDPIDAIKQNKRVDFVLYIDIDYIQEIKIIQNKTLTWTRLTDMKSWVNHINDLLYSKDKEIKL